MIDNNTELASKRYNISRGIWITCGRTQTGMGNRKKPIKLSIPSVRVYLDPQGQLPSVGTIQLKPFCTAYCLPLN